MNGPDDVSQSLSIEIVANADGAAETFERLEQVATDLPTSVEAANARLATSARETKDALQQAAQAATEASSRTAETLSQVGSAAEATAAKVRASGDAVAALHDRFSDDARLLENAAGEDGAQAIETATSRAKQLLEQARLELRAIRDDVVLGHATYAEGIAATQQVQRATLVHPGGKYTRADLRAGSDERDPDLMARNVAYVQSSRQLQTLQSEESQSTRRAAEEESAAVEGLAKQRVAAYRDQVRTGQMTVDEERVQLDQALKQYEGYAEARAIVDRRLTENTIAQNRERARTQSEGHGAVADAALNAGYLLPGSVGNALTNLGYIGQGGPASLAVGGAAVAAIGVGGALAGAAEVASKDQEAMERLGVAVHAQGADWDTLSKQVDAWAELQEKTTTFGRNQTIPALNELAVAGVNLGDAMRIVRVAEDASAATNKPLIDVTHQLLEAYNGNSRGLVTLGVVQRDAIRDGMSFSDVLSAIESKMSGQAMALDSFSKKQMQLRNDFDELARTIGEALLPSLTDAVGEMDGWVRGVDAAGAAKGIGATIQGIRDLGSAFGDLAQAAGPGIGVISELYGFMNKVDVAQINAVAGALHWWFGDRGIANSGLTTANLGVGGGAPGVYGGGSGASAPLGVPGDIGSAISAASERYAGTAGIPAAQLAAIITAVGQQETLLGRSSVYDPATGLSRTPGNQGHGIFQLDPMSGASPQELQRAATDVGYAADKAASMLAESLKRSHGNITTALAEYNAGGLSEKGLAYAQQVEGRLGPMQTNPADTHVVARQQAGGQPAYATDIAKAEATAQQERLAGVADWRQREEQAIQQVLDADTLSAKQRATIERQLADLRIADENDRIKTAKEADATADRNAQLDIAREENKRRARQESFAQEIANLRGLQAELAKRGLEGDPRAASEAESLQARIDRLQTEEQTAQERAVRAASTAWEHALKEQEAYYRRGKESLDQFVTALERLQGRSGTTPDQRGQAQDAIDKARAAAEAAAKKASDEQQRNDSALSSSFSSDAATGIREIDQRYKELQTDVSDTTTALASQKDLMSAGLYQSQIAALREMMVGYQQYGLNGVRSVQDIQHAIVVLSVSEHDATDRAQRDQQKELDQRAAEYKKFADEATTHIVGIWQNGTTAMQDFHDVFKSTFADFEQQLLKSGFASLLGQPGAAGDVNIGNSLERSIFGSTAPAGFFGGGQPSQSAEMQRAFAKIAAAPTGGADQPLTVQFAGGGIGPGGVGAGVNPFAAFESPSTISAVASNVASGGIIGGVIGASGAQTVASAVPYSSSGVTTAGGIAGGSGLSSSFLSTLLGGNTEANALYSSNANQFADASNFAPANSPTGNVASGYFGNIGSLGGLLKGGLAANVGGALTGLGLGTSIAGILGENTKNAGIGSALGAGVGLIGGPIGSAIGGTLGGFLGGLFGSHTSPKTSPDIYDTANFGQIVADLKGTMGANGQSFYEDLQTSNLFGGKTGLAGVEQLLSGGQAAFAASTGLKDPNQYAQYVKMFGDPSSGNGVLDFQHNIGQESVNAKGASGIYSYTDYGKALAAIEQGLGTTGAGMLGAFNTYSVRRALPDYNLALQESSKAVQQALQVGGAATGGAATGSGAPAGAAAGFSTDIHGNTVHPIIGGGGLREAPVTVNVDARGAFFDGANSATLATTVQKAVARQQSGQIPNPGSSLSRRPRP